MERNHDLADPTSMPSEELTLPSEELTLRRNAEFVRRILESNQDCIKVLDIDGHLLYMNHNGQKLMEIDQFDQQVKRKPWLVFWQGADRAAAAQAFEQARAGGTGTFQGYCATAKGTPKWWEVVVTPMLGEDQRVQEILSVSRDITARKQAELALQERNEELDQFAHVVSHDLKAPLRGIAHLATFLEEDLEGRLDDNTRHQLDLLRQRVTRMDSLIEGLLTLSRIGQQELDWETVELAALIAEIVDSLAIAPEFTVRYDNLPAKVLAKRLLLSQVLANLLSNAVKHHDATAGQIEIQVSQAESALQFTVTDDGPGVPEHSRDRIFGIFNTLNPDKHNTGVGLAIVKKIIIREGGNIRLEANHPRGCKFTFTLPLTSPVARQSASS